MSMKKIILIFTLCFSFISPIFSDGIWNEVINETSTIQNTCKEALCYENQVKKLIEVNEKLQKENEELSKKYEEFNKPLENYIKILSESKVLWDFKSNAYDLALNQIKYWFWIIFWIFSTLLAIWWYLWFKQWPDIRKRIISDIQTDIAISIDTKIDDKTKIINGSLEKEVELATLRINEEISYKKIKEIESTIMNSISDIVLNKTDELIKGWIIDTKIHDKISEELGKIFPK